METLYLGLKAKTPLQLYFETLILGYQEHFMMAFIVGGFSKDDLNKMNESIEEHKQRDAMLELMTTKMKEINRISELKEYLGIKS